MKKKILIIVLAVLFFVLIGRFFRQRQLSELIETAVVSYEKMTFEHEGVAQVHGKYHFQYFQGYLKQLRRQVNERVKENEIILVYVDERGREHELKAECCGYVNEIAADHLVLEDEQYRLYCCLPLERYRQLKIGQQGSFVLDGQIHLCEVSQLNERALMSEENDHYEVELRPLDELPLHGGQLLSIRIPLRQNYGLCIPAEALLEDEDGYFMIDGKYRQDPAHWEKYRIDVEVLYRNERQAMIEGVGLEGQEVCLLADLWQVIRND